MTVGVISDSIDQVAGGIAASQAAGDLPANVLTCSTIRAGTDEGRAMAEIVYDEAPGISGIAFTTANAAGRPARRRGSTTSSPTASA